MFILYCGLSIFFLILAVFGTAGIGLGKKDPTVAKDPQFARTEGDNEQHPTDLPITLLEAGTTIAPPVISDYTLPSRIKLSKQLRVRAHADFETARGTAHKRLLSDAAQRLKSEAAAIEQRVVELRKDITAKEKKRDTELRRAVVRPLVETELPKLPGIGPRLSAAILAGVFRGELDDLHHAYNLDGIGPQKQATLNRWVQEQKRRLPALLAGDFPEKDEILARHERPIDVRRNELLDTERELAAIRELSSLVNQELAWLTLINARDFEAAYARITGADKVVNRYQLGVFAPWEPLPDWFAKVIKMVGSPDQPIANIKGLDV